MARGTALRVNRAEDAAQFLLPIYLSLGPQRSVRRVHEMCSDVGIQISLKTLTRYSSIGGWVEKAREFDANAAARATSWSWDELMANDRRQVQLGRALQQVAIAEMAKRNQMRPTMADPPGLSEIARIADVGVKIERLGSGQATEIRQVLVGVYQIVTDQIARLWSDSMAASQRVYSEEAGVEDEDTHARAYNAAAAVFGPGVDRLIADHFTATGIGGVVIEGEMVEDDPIEAGEEEA